jgi:hypothetical protein
VGRNNGGERTGGLSEHYNFPIGVSCFNKFIYNSQTIERVSQSTSTEACGARHADSCYSCFVLLPVFRVETNIRPGVGDFTFSQAQEHEKVRVEE